MAIFADNYLLSLTHDDRILRVRCSQNDTSRQVNFTIYNNGTLFTIPSGLSVSVHGIKQNGNIFTKSCTYSGSVVTLVLDTQITNTVGVSVAELVFTNSSGGKIGTSNFIFQVESDPLLRGTIDVTEETPIEYIHDLISMVEALSARVNNIITPAGEASLSEVVDARLSGYSGTTYQNLKARIDADFAALDNTKADKSDTYTKQEVDAAIDNVTITTDETLSVPGAAADSKKVGDKISEINGSLENSGLLETKKEWLKEAEATSGYYSSATKISSSADYILFPVIPIEKNKRYFYKNIVRAFSWIIYDNGTSKTVGNGTTVADGWFTADDDGEIKITSRPANIANAIFTDYAPINTRGTQEDMTVPGEMFSRKDYNIYSKAIIKTGYPKNAAGEMSSGGVYAAVPVEYGNNYKILYPGFRGTFSSATLGFLAYYNDDEPLYAVNPGSLSIGTYGEDRYLVTSIPENCNYIRFAVSLSGLSMIDTCVVCESIYDFEDLDMLGGVDEISGLRIIDEYARNKLGADKPVSILSNQKIAAIGDSITQQTYWAATGWLRYIQQWTGCAIQNLGSSGCGFVASPTNYINDISDIESDVSIIGVACSFNDLNVSNIETGDITDTGTTTRCGYVNTFFDTLLTAHPTTPIICYIQNPWGAYHYGVSGADDYVSKVREICKRRGIPFYDELYSNGGVLKPWLSDNATEYFTCDTESDEHYGTTNNVHPNSKGHLAIARYIVSKFEENVLADNYV